MSRRSMPITKWAASGIQRQAIFSGPPPLARTLDCVTFIQVTCQAKWATSKIPDARIAGNCWLNATAITSPVITSRQRELAPAAPRQFLAAGRKYSRARSQTTHSSPGVAGSARQSPACSDPAGTAFRGTARGNPFAIAADFRWVRDADYRRGRLAPSRYSRLGTRYSRLARSEQRFPLGS